MITIVGFLKDNQLVSRTNIANPHFDKCEFAEKKGKKVIFSDEEDNITISVICNQDFNEVRTLTFTNPMQALVFKFKN